MLDTDSAIISNDISSTFISDSLVRNNMYYEVLPKGSIFSTCKNGSLVSLYGRYNGMGYKAPSQRTGYRSEVRPQTNYNASYKANSVEGRPNQRFDYV